MDKTDKKRLRSSTIAWIVAFLIMTSWAVVGIALALESANINIAGNISFTASDVSADITGTITGTKTTNTLDAIHLTEDTETFTTPDSWKNMKLDFVKSTNLITITVSIKNNNSTRPIYVSITDGVKNITNTTIIKKVNGSTVSELSTFTVNANSTTTFTIELKVTDLNSSVKSDVSLAIDLKNDAN